MDPRPYQEVVERLDAYRSRYMGKHLKAFLEMTPEERMAAIAPWPELPRLRPVAPPEPPPVSPALVVVEAPVVDEIVEAAAPVNEPAAEPLAEPAVAPAVVAAPAPAKVVPLRPRLAVPKPAIVVRRYAVAAALVALSVLLSVFAFKYQDGGTLSRVITPASAPGAVAGVVRAASETTIGAEAPFRIEDVLIEPGQSVKAGDPLFVVEDQEAREALPAARLEVEDARLQVEALESALGSLDRQIRGLSSRLVSLSGELDVASRNAAAVPSPQVRASTARAQATYDQADVKLRRYRQLFAGGVIARQQVDDAEVELRVARDDLEMARKAEDAYAQTAAAEASRADLRRQLAAVQEQKERMRRGAELQRARVQHDRAAAALAALEARAARSRIDAPAAGVIGEVRVSRGDVVSVGAVLARVADATRLVAEVQVPSLEIPRLRRGGPAFVTVSTFSNAAAAGTIRSIEPTPGPNGTHRVVVGFSAPKGVSLGGQAASVTFPEAPAERVATAASE
jgi:multidrug resistance efflux pump